MNICDGVKDKENVSLFVSGRLYKWTHIYIATSDGKLVNLETGNVYDHKSTIGSKDVTDSYCLQKVE